MATVEQPSNTTLTVKRRYRPYEDWIESLGMPIYRDYYLEDLRTLKLGRWEDRGCDGAFIELVGQQGVTGAYVIEIPPGETIAPFRLPMDEVCYILQGRGITSIKASESGSAKTFEWDARSLFMLPANHSYQLSNTTGNQTVRALICNYLPLVMSVMTSKDYLFDAPAKTPELLTGNGNFYSQAKVFPTHETAQVGTYWVGNFFPDMAAWDKMDALPKRGAGGRVILVEFPGSPLTAHMSVFPPRMYKKGHRHGPGFVIVIPKGEGYSIMWPEGGEKVVIPWHEGSCFVPPMRWFHQHFNVSDHPDRYLAIHPPRGLSDSGEVIENRASDQFEYPDEDPMVRERFEAELAKRGLTSAMPAEAYTDPDYSFSLMKDI